MTSHDIGHNEGVDQVLRSETAGAAVLALGRASLSRLCWTSPREAKRQIIHRSVLR